MPRVTYFAIPADVPDRAMHFYREVFGWQFEAGWEYDTPQGREQYWHDHWRRRLYRHQWRAYPTGIPWPTH
jgi:hypothetical protein